MDKISTGSVAHTTFVHERLRSILPVFSSLLPAIVIVLLHVVHMLVLPALASSMIIMSHDDTAMSGTGGINGMTMNTMSGMDHHSMHSMNGDSITSDIPWMEIVMGAIWIISIVSILQAGYQWWKLLRSKSITKIHYVCAGFSTISLCVAIYSMVMMVG
ncbi:hypothetical protein [Paenibacillus wenxiniae]|uniref:DUF2231 domain-containing protein n=1 Tax=Paenibacillus wenxiniae TaxID=1636843 RepID=A0ABW4RFB9_9BACL